jgi:hypothetical protein
MLNERMAKTLENARTVDCTQCLYYGLRGCIDSDAYMQCKGPGANPWGGLWEAKIHCADGEELVERELKRKGRWR